MNIVAHSKGGLDARYMISHLDMGGAVASLTTIATPHRGSELLNLLCRLPDPVYRRITRQIDRVFAKAGDPCPDAYHASRQLSPAFCADLSAIRHFIKWYWPLPFRSWYRTVLQIL